MDLILLIFTFVLAAFLGFELIAKVPSQLHTPLMSGSNAISGITMVGAILIAGQSSGGSLGAGWDLPLSCLQPSMWWVATWSPIACWGCLK